ncbi:MAG: ATP-dependent Zn protease [Cyanobacteria bacterium J06649_4]
MNPTTLNLLAVSVFAFTMLSLVGPLLNISPGAVAIALSGIAGVIAIDRFGAQGKGGNLLIDLVSRQSSEYRQRILRHEAGHFLVAHLLDIPVQSYTLSAWEATKAGLPGLGGVVFDTAPIEAALEAGSLSAQQINRYCIVWMAGIAAENQTYGNAQGGQDDQMKLRILWQQIAQSKQSQSKQDQSKQAQSNRTDLSSNPNAAREIDTQLRWALLQAQTLLEKQSAAYDALLEAMAAREPVETCRAQIEQNRVEQSASFATSLT